MIDRITNYHIDLQISLIILFVQSPIPFLRPYATPGKPCLMIPVPELHITTEIDRENIDRESYRVCTCTITNANTDDCLSDVVGQIKGRGNSTWILVVKKDMNPLTFGSIGKA
mgnify:CR=1 FL=1